VIQHDLDAIVDGLVPELQRAGAFRTAYDPGLFRERLGLTRPENRYAPSGSSGSSASTGRGRVREGSGA
jgi:hypothetical protein